MKKTRGEAVFQVFDIFTMLVVVCLIIMPLMHIASISISNKEAVMSLSVGIFPKGFSLAAYKEIITKQVFIRSLLNTVGLTVITSVLSLVVNVMAAYGFSKTFYAKKLITYVFILTMYFSGGLIPSYILVTKFLHLYNSYLAFILPGLVNVFYIIIIRSQIEAVPPSLSEAAKIDGATESQVLMYIIIPAISATIASIAMFIALGMWNMWFSVLIYSNKKEMWTLQYFLRALVFDKLLEYQPGAADSVKAVSDAEGTSSQNYQMAAIILVALPIVSIYPFVQKYFVKGILAGSVKD